MVGAGGGEEEGTGMKLGGLGLEEVVGDRSAPPWASLYTSVRELGAVCREGTTKGPQLTEGGDWIVGGKAGGGEALDGTVSMAWCGCLKRWQGGNNSTLMSPSVLIRL